MITCKATFHQGQEYEEVTATGDTRARAFLAAVQAQNIGFRSTTPNQSAALALLGRFEDGIRPPEGEPFLKEGYTHLKVADDGQPVIMIGWTTYTFQRIRLWAIGATVTTKSGPFDGSRQVPTFYLDPNVQGIVNEAGAVKVAEDILHTLAGDAPGVKLSVTAEPIY